MAVFPFLMKKRILIPIALTTLGISLVAKAQLGYVEKRFKEFDKDGNGEISGSEMYAASYLRELDLDANGSLTLEEAKRAVEAREGKKKTGVPAFDDLDQNGDGLITANELPKKAWMKFLDLDNNGFITLQEATEALSRLKKKGAESPDLLPSKPASEDPEWKEAPALLKAADHGVNRLVPDLPLQDLTGKAQSLGTSKPTCGIIVAFFGATCPISGKLGPELARLEKEAQDLQVRMLLVCPVSAETRQDIDAFVAAHQLTSPVIHDQTGQLTDTLAAKTTTEVFLLDSVRTLIYRGAINDQYGLGYSKAKPNKTYLRDALAAMLRHEAPSVAATTAPGCALDRPSTKALAAAVTDVTYHNRVSRILQANCVECHRQDGVGPFSLESYQDVIEHAGMIRKQVERNAMPPWFAATPPQGEHSPFINDSSLTPEDKATLLTWLAGPRPEGDAHDAPEARHYPKEWVLGEPDAVVQLPKPISIQAEGTMPYQFVTVATDFAEDKWVQAYDIVPTDRRVVHHVIVQVHPKGSDIRDRGEGSEGYWAAYVPGNTAHHYPKGFARKLPAGATISFQIHYTPIGKSTTDQLKMGLTFAKEAPRFIVHTASVAQHRLNIPPNEANHLEFKDQKVPMDLNVMGYMAHMHLRGKSFKFEVTTPEGKPETLLDIPRYDFNWQLRYDYAQPRFLPKGSTVRITATFDNSDQNPANPDPTKSVRWGLQTFEEMMIGYVEYYTPNPALVTSATNP